MDSTRIIQLLVLFDEESVRELSPLLWAVLIETERFFNHDQPRAAFERHFISPHEPPSNMLLSTVRTVARLFGRDIGGAQALLCEQERRPYPAESEVSIQGKYAKTINQRKVWRTVRKAIGTEHDETYLLIVTDREITPPPEWRYIIWDGDGERNGIVSVAPTDPTYWRQRDPSRYATIKHRVRAACLSITGEYLGLTRCDNCSCFLYEDVGSVLTLDTMTGLGGEHELPRLAGLGFAVAARDVATVQTPIPVEPS